MSNQLLEGSLRQYDEIEQEWINPCDGEVTVKKHIFTLPEQLPLYIRYNTWLDWINDQNGIWLRNATVRYDVFDISTKANIVESKIEHLTTWKTFKNWNEMINYNNGNWFKDATVIINFKNIK